jgi:hypothetical protein
MGYGFGKVNYLMRRVGGCPTAQPNAGTDSLQRATKRHKQ